MFIVTNKLLLLGDWRQTLPVIPRGYKSDIIAACLTQASFWPTVHNLHLKTNMRVLHANLSPAERNQANEFANWLLSIGNGLTDDLDNQRVTLPADILLPPGKASIPTLINSVYGDIDVDCTESEQLQYLSDCAILAPRNRDVDDLNSSILDNMPGPTEIFPSADSAVDPSGSGIASTTLYPTEFLNSINIGGFPLHRLALKVGCPIMLLRNLDPTTGMCNGTRLIVSQMSRRVIEAIIMCGPHAGEHCFIPRIPLSSSDNSRLPFNLQRLQFPVRLAFAMSINKAQGQSLRHLGLFLLDEVFSHGQLYVALSRATECSGIIALLNNTEAGMQNTTKNVVYKEILP